MRRPLLTLLPLLAVAVPVWAQGVTATPAVQVPAAAAAALEPQVRAAAVEPVRQAAPAPPVVAADDPSTWPDRRLAASLVLAGYDMGRTDDALPWVEQGLGGVVLFGTPPADLGARLARLRAAGPVVPLVASDEEGGRVQRLTALLGALPSAEEQGRTRSPEQVQALAAQYAAGMAGLGVDTALSPVADLSVPGHYVERTDRAFSTDPATVGAYAGAWAAGMRSQRVVPVAKHWPGHGSASDTHQQAATTPPLSTLQTRDLVPFDALHAAGVPAVMVGHLTVPELTEPGTPATLSPAAYRFLRERAGADAVLMTDSLSMAAITLGAGLPPAQAAVRALAAGADVVLVDPGAGPGPLVDAVSAALAAGAYPREAAVASARRVLGLKRIANAPLRAAPTAAQGTRRPGLTPTLTATVGDRVGGVLTAQFFVRSAGTEGWNVVNAAAVPAPAGGTASYRVPGGRLLPGQEYEWTVRACNAAAVCSAPADVGRFTTRAA